MSNGLIHNWDLAESIWEYTLTDRLRVQPNEHPLLMAEPAHNTTEKREKMTEIMFERFEIPALFVAKDPVLICFANARSTGLVIDSCGEMTTCTPVFEGYALQKGIVRSSLGGNRVSDELVSLLELKTGKKILPAYAARKKSLGDGRFQSVYLDFPNTTASYRRWATQLVADDLKHTVCRVFDSKFDANANANIPCVQYELPDGNILDVGPERFAASDLLFDPSELADQTNFNAEPLIGLHQVIHNSISKCDIDLRRELYSNIIVTGGNTLLPGFTERLNKELLDSGPPQKIKLIATNYAAERKYAVWIGGSILASLGSFQQMWMSKEEYLEFGSSLVDRKCP